MNMDKTARAAAIFLLLLLLALNLAGCAPKAILLFDDFVNHFAEEALDMLFDRYTVVDNWEDFMTAFQSRAWDLLVVDNPTEPDPEIGPIPIMYDFINKGGRAVISSMNIGVHGILPLWSKLGYTSCDCPYPLPKSVYRLDPTFSIWLKPNEAPDLQFDDADDPSDVSDGYPGSATSGGEILASFDTSAPSTTGAVFVANDGRTILNSFLLDSGVEDHIPMDKDGDSIADSVEWWMNEIRYVSSKPGKSIQPIYDTP